MQEKYKNSYKATEKELVSLSVYNVGYQNCDPGYQWGPGIRDHYLIHYIISGKGTMVQPQNFSGAESMFEVSADLAASKVSVAVGRQQAFSGG